MTSSIIAQPTQNSTPQRNNNGFAQRVKASLSIAEIVRNSDKFDMVGDPPTHGEWTGHHTAHATQSGKSFSVNVKKGIWQCWSCGWRGDTLDLIGRIEHGENYSRQNGTFVDTLETAAKMAGLEMPNSMPPEQREEKRVIQAIHNAAAAFYHAQLADSHRDHLRIHYGIIDATIDKLLIGYAPAQETALFAHLQSQGYSVPDILKAGLVHRFESGTISDVFQGRLMFPYLKGNSVVYFIGRQTETTPEWSKSKYHKLPVSDDAKRPYISKHVDNRLFYGEDSARGANELFITEGVTDCIAMLQAGFACISPVTVRFAGKDHPKILHLATHAKIVYIINDNEESGAGDKGALATAKMLWENGKPCKLVTLPLPDGQDKIDLNEFLRDNSAEDLANLLPNAPTLLDLYVKNVDGKEGEDWDSAAKKVFDLLASVSDDYALARHKRSISTKLDISRAEYDVFLKSARGNAEVPDRQQPAPAPRPNTYITDASPIGDDKALSEKRMLLALPATDYGNAESFKARYGNLFRHNGSHGWHFYEGKSWVRGDMANKRLKSLVTEVLSVRHAYARSAEYRDEEMIEITKTNSSKISACVKILEGDPVMHADISEFDSDPLLLNCQNGVVDLRCRKLHPHDQKHMLAHYIDVPYIEDTVYNKWEGWLSSVVKDYDGIADWLQMLVGYSITGDTSEESFVYVQGPGRSGKGTFSRAISNVLGKPLCQHKSFGDFMAKSLGKETGFDMAGYETARVIIASEANKNLRLDVAKLKNITGGDEVKASYKGKDEYTYLPKFKIWLLANPDVKADPDDDAFWARVKVVRFPNSYIGKEDKSLKNHLMASDEMKQQVLAWAIDGARMWYMSPNGLETPQAVRDETQRSRDENDGIGLWLRDNCTTSPGVKDTTMVSSIADLHTNLLEWCEVNGKDEITKKSMTVALKSKGFFYGKPSVKGVDGKKHQVRGFFGISINLDK